jgi:hypothetical protein
MDGIEERLNTMSRLQLELGHRITCALPAVNPYTPSLASKRSKASQLRRNIRKLYGFPSNTSAVCMVSGFKDEGVGAVNVEDPARVVAAHIWPRDPRYPLLQQFDGGIDDGHNGMFLVRAIERAFDSLEVCFIVNPFESTLMFYVLHQDKLFGEKPGNCEASYKQLHRTKSVYPAEPRPSFELLVGHCNLAVAHALVGEWITGDEATEIARYQERVTPLCSSSSDSNHGDEDNDEEVTAWSSSTKAESAVVVDVCGTEGFGSQEGLEINSSLMCPPDASTLHPSRSDVSAPYAPQQSTKPKKSRKQKSKKKLSSLEDPNCPEGLVGSCAVNNTAPTPKSERMGSKPKAVATVISRPIPISAPTPKSERMGSNPKAVGTVIPRPKPKSAP